LEPNSGKVNVMNSFTIVTYRPDVIVTALPSFILKNERANDTERRYPTPYSYFLAVKCFQIKFIRICFTQTPHVLFIHTTGQFKMSVIWHYQVTTNIWVFVH